MMANNIVLMPIYEDKESASILLIALKEKLGDDLFIIAIDDGSIKFPLDGIILKEAGLHGHVIKLKRNLGHQRAIAVGISYVAKYFPKSNCVVMDSDGEDKPESVRDMLSTLNNCEEEIVVATRKSRVETLKFKIFYFFYKYLFRILAGRKITFGNFMAMKPVAVQRLSVMQELWVHVAGCTLVSRLRLKQMPVDRGARYKGKSKMNFNSLVLHGFRAVMVFAEDVLVRVGVLCMSVGMLSLLAIYLTILLKSIGFATPGWFSIAIAVLFIVLLQTAALTLISLMLSGIMKGSNIVVDDFEKIILKVVTV